MNRRVLIVLACALVAVSQAQSRRAAMFTEVVGSVQVVVDTQDEWSTRVQPKLDSRGRIELEGVVLSEDNLLGTGRHFSLFYDEEEDEREEEAYHGRRGR